MYTTTNIAGSIMNGQQTDTLTNEQIELKEDELKLALEGTAERINALYQNALSCKLRLINIMMEEANRLNDVDKCFGKLDENNFT